LPGQFFFEVGSDKEEKDKRNTNTGANVRQGRRTRSRSAYLGKQMLGEI